MTERTDIVPEETMKFGLLMESALTHQRMAESHLERLQAHTEDLDTLVRDEIRRTLVEELQSLMAETERATTALRHMKRAANMRVLLWNAGIALLCTAIPTAAGYWLLPSTSSVAALRLQHEALAQNIVRLTQQGGKVDWRSCGESARLCVRVDRKAPVYGDKGDYLVVKGY